MRLSVVSMYLSFDLWLWEQPETDDNTIRAVAGSPAADLTQSVSDAADEWTTYEDRNGFGVTG